MTFLAFYNAEHVGDTLLLLKKETTQVVASESKGDVTRVFIADTNETVAYNIFNVSQYITPSGTGHVTLDDTQVSAINALLTQVGFDTIAVDNRPKFVIGKVVSCQDHPDSDHLHVTQVDTGEASLSQIVCGAPNVAEGQLVVVAKIGAVMPSGLIIWPGELRGVASNGMLCSAKELALPDAPSKRGILVLSEGNVGQAFFK